MTVKEFLNVCEDLEDVVISYYVILEDGEKIGIEYFPTRKLWISDFWHYDEDEDQIVGEIMIDTDTLLNAEIIGIQLGNFTNIKVRL